MEIDQFVRGEGRIFFANTLATIGVHVEFEDGLVENKLILLNHLIFILLFAVEEVFREELHWSKKSKILIKAFITDKVVWAGLFDYFDTQIITVAQSSIISEQKNCLV